MILKIIEITMLLAIICSIYGCSSISCTEKSDAVLYARTLTQDRLTRLYQDMKRFSTKNDLPLGGFNKYHKETKTPKEFKDLKVVKIRPADGNIMIKGCFDHYVYLNFHGYGTLKTIYPKREIVLSWGEYTNAGSEVIWSEK
jgi:hypothetical protein